MSEEQFSSKEPPAKGGPQTSSKNASIWSLWPRRDDGLFPITENDQIPQFEKVLDRIVERQMLSSWRGLQSFILRGLCGGLLASLALVGSQLFSGNLRENIAYLTTVFIIGLLFEGVRMVIEGMGGLQSFMGQAIRIQHQKTGYTAGHGWRSFALVLDALSALILIGGVVYGLTILYGEASAPIQHPLLESAETPLNN